MNPSIQPSPYLRTLAPIPPWGIFLSGTANNPIPPLKAAILYCQWIFYLPHCILLCISLLAFDDAFSRSASRQWLFIIHVIILPYGRLPNGLCIFSWLQKPRYNAWPFASIPILMFSLCRTPPSFPPVLLARYANYSSVTHDSSALCAAD